MAVFDRYHRAALPESRYVLHADDQPPESAGSPVYDRCDECGAIAQTIARRVLLVVPEGWKRHLAATVGEVQLCLHHTHRRIDDLVARGWIVVARRTVGGVAFPRHFLD